MTRIQLTALFCGAALLANGAEQKLRPVAEGMLIDRNGDGIVDLVQLHSEEKPQLELLVGRLGNGGHRSVLEFRLPNLTKISRATLTVMLNGKTGCHPDAPGTIGPKTLVWSFSGAEADGRVEISDDGAGEQSDVLLENKAADVTRPVTVDVTEVVRKAVAAKAAFIGFRLEAADEKKAPAVWRFRSSEFAGRYTASAYPTLTIVTE